VKTFLYFRQNTKYQTYGLIKYSYQNSKPLGDDVNRDLIRNFCLYMLIGGMPQAKNAYLESYDNHKTGVKMRFICNKIGANICVVCNGIEPFVQKWAYVRHNDFADERRAIADFEQDARTQAYHNDSNLRESDGKHG